jgi:predicted Rossmann-fold nucleotide-binding protein
MLRARGLAVPGKVVGPGANPLRYLPRAGAGERIVFGVMGGGGAHTPAEVSEAMHALGGAIAKGGHVTLTGALGGLPGEAHRGARAAGGLTVGISSYRTVEAHVEAGNPTDFDILQLTELPPALRGTNRPNYMGREIDNIERSDVIVIAGGRFGTLGELAIAFEERRPIGVLTGTGGISDIVPQIVEASTKAGKPPGAPVLYDSDPVRLVRRLTAAKREMDRAGAPRGPLGDDHEPARVR